jgi:ornithine carbamoyltransferase
MLADERALIEQARGLRHAAAAGRPPLLLRGRNLGLLCPDVNTAPALLFRDAALQLGAQVAHIDVGPLTRSSAQELLHTARMLGRLYDAVECQCLDSRVVQQISALAGITVYDGLATDDALIAYLALQLGDAAMLAENRRYALQALLLQSLT